MTTYQPNKDRAEYAMATLDGLLWHLECKSLHLHIADDGTEDYTNIKEMVRIASLYFGQVTWSNAERHGIGASLNLALKHVSDKWMYITDDWVLQDWLHLNKPLKLIDDYGYDLVRIGTIHPNLACITKFSQELGWWLELELKDGFVFGTRPFIATKAFYNEIGPFTEDTNAYEVERIYNERVIADGRAKVAHVGTLEGSFEHIGLVEVGDKFP